MRLTAAAAADDDDGDAGRAMETSDVTADYERLARNAVGLRHPSLI